MFAKILLTVAVVAFIWFGFKFLQRHMAEKSRRDGLARQDHRLPPGGRTPKRHETEVQDLVRCPACGVWKSSNTPCSCGRP